MNFLLARAIIFATVTDPQLRSTMSNTADAPSNPKPSQDELDIDKILNREASAFQRETEVDRILKAFRLKYAIPSQFF